MKTVLFMIGLLIGTAFAATDEVAVPDFSGRPYDEHPILAPCTRFDDRYDLLQFRDRNIDKWPDIYHDQVKRVVEEFMEPVELECNAEDYEALLEPGTQLTDLAASLPTWNDPDVPLSRFDISRVLLEYLRVYECALMEYDVFLYFDTAQEQFSEEQAKQGVTHVAFFDFFFSDLLDEAAIRAETIKRERLIARKTLKRVLTLIATAERLRPLEAELECMQRLSIDIRNTASLTAEASSCLPRVWNAKDILRDYKEDEE